MTDSPCQSTFRFAEPLRITGELLIGEVCHRQHSLADNRGCTCQNVSKLNGSTGFMAGLKTEKPQTPVTSPGNSKSPGEQLFATSNSCAIIYTLPSISIVGEMAIATPTPPSKSPTTGSVKPTYWPCRLPFVWPPPSPMFPLKMISAG